MGITEAKCRYVQTIFFESFIMQKHENTSIQQEENAYEVDNLLSLTAQIVSSHLYAAQMPAEEIPEFIDTVHTKLVEIATKTSLLPKQKPALPVEESVTPDFIFCLEDGKKFRMLKKHLRSYYDMSPAQYRAKWGLDADYPMVAPNYAAKRQELAKLSGLGKKRD